MTAKLTEFLSIADWPSGYPPLFGRFHIVYLIIGFSAALAAALLLRRADDKQNRAILLAAGICLLASEIWKQLFSCFVVGYDRYDFILFPFHLCSMPMYLCFFAALLRDGVAKNTVCDFLGGYCFLGGLMSVTVDSGMLQRHYLAMVLHGMNWHFALIFIGLYLGFAGRLGRNKFAFARSFMMFLFLAAIAFTINVIFYKTSGGTCDMFFIGPAKMNVVGYKEIGEAIGRPLVTAFYIATLTAASFACWLALNAIGKRFRGR